MSPACAQRHCTGAIAGDGYCDVCGVAATPRRGGPGPTPDRPTANRPATPRTPASTPAHDAAPNRPATAGTPASTPAHDAAPNRPPTRGTPGSTPGSRRAGATTGTPTSGRGRLGAGLVEIPSVAYRDPSTAVMADPTVAESRRFCAACDAPVGRARDGASGRSEGFCRKCGAPFSFAPKLAAGDVVGGQYEVAGCLAHGGMGWVYLAQDRNVSARWVVLKGLLNAGDHDAMAAALAERRFLAEVEHPNVVKIFNFVEHDGSGYIVMEYVGGTSLKQILAARREANGGRPDPLPVAQAIAYVLEILPALGYLHQTGLLFCDLKVDNVIQTPHALKLIDLGGVYPIDEPPTTVFGTVGYQAPEIAAEGPSIPSDLFTVARTLAILCLDFPTYQTAHRFTLPPPDQAPPLDRCDSLHRFLLRATAAEPGERFQSAEEMADQLYGVLREVVAAEEGRAIAGLSTRFAPALGGRPEEPDWRRLPRPQVASDDPAAGFLATVRAIDPEHLIEQLRAAPVPTTEVNLRLAAAMIETADWDGVDAVLRAVEDGDPWDWRAPWYRGVAALARTRPVEADDHFTVVYRALPGELVPKLALGVACEYAGRTAQAARWYEIVAQTDPSYTSAAFGLARCRAAAGDRAGAMAAYDRVPDTSSAHVEAQVARIRCLITARNPSLTELAAAGERLDHLALEGEPRLRLTAGLLEAGLRLVQAPNGAGPDGPPVELVGCPAAEQPLRVALERTYRALARHAPTSVARYRLVDQANRIRPRTWT